MIIVILSLAFSGVFLFVKDRIVNSIPIIVYGVLFVLSFIWSLFNKDVNVILRYIPSVLVIAQLAIYFYLSMNTEFDFSKKIITLQTIKNVFVKPEGYHVLGKVVPHNVYTLEYNDYYLAQDEQSTARVTFATGSSGSGKTRMIKSLAKQDIEQGRPLVFCEYKGDKDLVKEIEDYAKSAGYQTFKIYGDVSNFNYDPFRNIHNSSRVESIMNMRNWDNAPDYFRQGTQLLLQITIADYTKIWEENKNRSYLLGYAEYMKKYNYSKEDKANGSYDTVNSLLSLLLESTLKDMFYYKYAMELDFAKMKNEKICVIVSFPYSSRTLATLFTSMLVTDLQGALLIGGQPNQNIMFYGDETGILDNPQIMNGLVTQGRSSKIATLLSFQDIFQMPEKLLNSWLGCANTFLIFNGTTKEAAAKLSGVQVSEADYLIMTPRSPNKEKRDNGTCIFITKAPVLNKRSSSEIFKFQPLINDKHSINEGPVKMDKRSKEEKPAVNVYDEKLHEDYSKPIDLGIEVEDFDENKFQEESTNNYLDLL